MTSSNKVTQPGEIRADQLEPGMWVLPVTRHDGVAPGLVLFRTDPDPADGLVALVSQQAGGYPVAANVPSDARFVVAAADQVEQAKEAGRRRLIARQMRDLADLIERYDDLPLPKYPSMSMGRGLSRAALERVSEVVGVSIVRQYGDRHPDRVVRLGGFDTFHAEWSGKWEDEQPAADAAAIVAESTAEAVPVAPKPAPPRKAAVKRSPAVDKTKKCPCGLDPAFAAPEAHDKPECQHRIGTGA